MQLLYGTGETVRDRQNIGDSERRAATLWDARESERHVATPWNRRDSERKPATIVDSERCAVTPWH